MQTRSGTLTDNGTVDLGSMIDPIITVTGGTWGSGTLKINFDGVPMSAGETADFYQIYDSCGRKTKVTAVLTGATAPNLVIKALHQDSY